MKENNNNAMKNEMNQNNRMEKKIDSHFSVKIVRMKGDIAPMVKVDFIDKAGQEHAGLMLLDSCCSRCVLSSVMNQYLDCPTGEQGRQFDIVTVAGAKSKGRAVSFSFAMGGEQFNIEACIACEPIVKIQGSLPFVGVIGLDFLLKHGLVIDYTKHTLHASTTTPANLSICDCDFFYPMQLGLDYYGLPVLCLQRADGEPIPVLPDTGASFNVVSKALFKPADQAELDAEADDSCVKYLSGQVPTKTIMLSFSLVTLNGEDQKTIACKDVFRVMPCFVMEPAAHAGEDTPEPIGVVVGASFMARAGWTLDFGARIIYHKRKAEAHDCFTLGDMRVAHATASPAVDKADAPSVHDGRIPFYTDVNDAGLIFIRVAEGDFEGVVFMLDTGSDSNVLFGYAHDQLSDLLTELDESGNVLLGIEGDLQRVSAVSGTLRFLGRDYGMKFLVSSDDYSGQQVSRAMGFPMAGIIGTKFMAAHGWVLDLRRQQVIVAQADESASEPSAHAMK